MITSENEPKEDAVQGRQLEETRAKLSQLIVRDMKTPLTGLANLLEMVDRDSLKQFKEDASGYVNEALGATETLEESVEFLMGVRKLMAGEEGFDKQPCDLLELARNVSETVAEGALASEVSLTVDGDSATLLCDKPKVTRVLRHVIRLALKGKPRKNEVKVRVARVSGRILLTVDSTGGGLGAVHDADVLGHTYCRLVAEGHGGKFGIKRSSGSPERWWLSLPEAGEIVTVPVAVDTATADGPERSHRYPDGASRRLGKNRSLVKQGTRQQFGVAVALMTVIPLLAFTYVLGDAIASRSLNLETVYFLLPSVGALVAMGVMLLARHTIEVNQLRTYLELMSRGELPTTGVGDSNDDFAAIKRSLGMVIKQGDEKIKKIEARAVALVKAEQQRVMAETVGAACHHLGQPATVIRVYLDLMKRAETSPEMQSMIQECQLATEDVVTVLQRLQDVGTYETEPYLSNHEEQVGLMDERILKI